MTKALDEVLSRDVVTIESVSNRTPDGAYVAPVSRIDGPEVKQLAVAVARVGGTRNGFNRAVGVAPAAASRGLVYSMAGWGGASEGQGAESAAGVDGVGDTALFNFVLRPNRDSLLRPADVTTNGDAVGVLSELILDRGTEQWPLSHDPGAMRALKWLGETEPLLSSDPRSAYWTQDLTQGATNAIIARLDRLAYPEGRDFTREEFTKARDELIQELDWVGNVRKYLKDLSSPFDTGAALESWITAQDVADKVRDAVRPPDDETVMSWIEFVKIILHLAGPFTHEVTGEVASLLDLGVWAYGANGSGAPTGDEFHVKANELGKELVDRALDAETTYNRVGDAIVSDYRALKEIGTYGGCNPKGDKCKPQFAFTKADRDAASIAVYRATQAIAYEKLIPLAYQAFKLNPALLSKAPSNIPEQFTCGFFPPPPPPAAPFQPRRLRDRAARARPIRPAK